MTGQEAAQAVYEAERKYREAAYALGKAKSDEYERAKIVEEVAWTAYAAAKTALRAHLYQTYGVDLITLDRMIRG